MPHPPTLTRRRALLALMALAWIALWPLEPTAPVIVRADFGASVLVPAIISALGSLFGLFKGKTSGNMSFALEGIRTGIVDLGRKIVDGLLVVAWQFARLWDWLLKWVPRIFAKLYDVIRAIVTRLSGWLNKIFGPILDFLDKVRHHLNEIYKNIIRPILDMIEMLRVFTRLLSSVGIEWAKELDAKLAELERKIVEPYNFVLGWLNRINATIDRIITLDGLLQRVTLLGSLMRDAFELTNIGLNTLHKPLDAGGLERYKRAWEQRPLSEFNAVAEAYIVRRGGPDRGRIDEHVADIRLRLGWL